ncbi:PEX11 domain protein [Aspergillus ibericus CBS 121593]|uniref:PEX11 domain protein n=1 Tax=Aspergillus ibericus CBS 121593 TaxID=1448316 RepID=A0A395GMM8_9EURO|nr:PEX11 domain protein [Aspergillus ibericus CBS 121593]RAK96087.1 PEX11 domain protein [Aspergillus ibericus CBS 121593]
MSSHLTRFTRTTPGLEKTLRLIQSLCVLALQIPDLDSVAVLRVGIAKQQLALTRRFLRFFNFIDCFHRGFALLGTPSTPSPTSPSDTWGELLRIVLEITKWGCFGWYFLLEDLTLLHATSISPLPDTWNQTLLTEANKFWFYALGVSMLESGWAFISLVFSAQKNDPEKEGKTHETKMTRGRVSSSSLFKKVLVDACDLLIPGTFLGWIAMEQGGVGVGVGMVVSTLLSGWEIWKAV